MGAVPIPREVKGLQDGTSCVPGLVAPLSPRDISQLQPLQRVNPNRPHWLRGLSVGLVDERSRWLRIAGVRLTTSAHAELKAESANRGRGRERALEQRPN